MEDKITIIEGPPPTFEEITDGWALGLSEGSMLGDIAVLTGGQAISERIVGRYAAAPVVHPETGEILTDRNEEIDELTAHLVEELVGHQCRRVHHLRLPQGMCRVSP